MQSPFLTRLTALAIFLIALVPTAASAATPEQIQQSIASATAWIRTQQDPSSGALNGFGGDWALTALAAAGVHPADVHGPNPGDPSLVDYYTEQWTSPEFSAPTDPAVNENPNFYTAADYARVTLLAYASGVDASRLSADQNTIAQLAALWKTDGSYGQSSLFNHGVFGALALASAGAPAVLQARSARLIRENQHNDGGWGYGSIVGDSSKAEAAGDVDMTGAALSALCTTGATTADPVVADGVAFLESKFEPASGAFAAAFGVNADSNAWALHGLLSCGVDIGVAPWTTPGGKSPQDFLLSLQRTSGPDAGSFKYEPSEAEDAFPNLYSTQDALRGLAGSGFIVAPPGRENGADPSELPSPEVPNGTAVPISLLVDNGSGTLRFCRVTVPTGATVAEVLTTAQTSSTPSNCVFGLQLDADDNVTALNGRSDPTNPWQASTRLDGEGPAGSQTVGLGDFVYLRLPGVGAVQPASTEPIAFGDQVDGTLGRPRDLYVRVDVAPVEPRFAVTGANREDFIVADGDCHRGAMEPGAGCVVRLRFAPSSLGERTAELIALTPLGPYGPPIALSGNGVAPAVAPGSAGPSGAPGAQGLTGPRGDTGPIGKRGPQGKPGRNARIACKIRHRRSGKSRTRCSVNRR